VSFTLVTSSCPLLLSECETALAANSVNLKDLIFSCDYLYTQTKPRRGAVGWVSLCCEQLKLCFVTAALIWKVWSNDTTKYVRTDICKIWNSRMHCASEDISLSVCEPLCSWICSGSLGVITVSTVQLQNIQFFEYVYSKCAMLMCSWTCSGSLCVITVSTVQLQNVQFVEYVYSKCAVLLCSWTCRSSFRVITVSTVQLQNVQFLEYM